MSFIYHRTIAITRPTHPSGVGAVAYGGQVPSGETPVISGLPASIQLSKSGGKGMDLPGDSKDTMWRIFFMAPNGTVKEQDVITDDLGERYQVSGAYWNSLGYRCLCLKLQT